MKKYIFCTGFFLILWVGTSSVFGVSIEAETTPKSVIKFATEATYPPIVSMDAAGNVGGFETELLKSICKEAQLQCEFHHRPFDSLFPSLSFKKIDAVYGGIGITEARKAQVLFSKTLYTMPVGFIFKAESFKDKTIGVQQGATGFEAYLKNRYPEAQLKMYASIQDALLDLNTKRIQAVFGDIPVLKYWLAHNHSEKSEFNFLELKPEEVIEFSQGNAIAVLKGKEALIHQINEAFDKMVADGTFDSLKQKYWN